MMMEASVQRPRQAADRGGHRLTPAELNAVRAAFKVGVKPLQIARQFGWSQSDVRQALASDASVGAGPWACATCSARRRNASTIRQSG
jgi:hypothetical protein